MNVTSSGFGWLEVRFAFYKHVWSVYKGFDEKYSIGKDDVNLG